MPHPLNAFSFAAGVAPAATLPDPSVTAQVVRELRAAAADAEGVAEGLRQAADAAEAAHRRAAERAA